MTRKTKASLLTAAIAAIGITGPVRAAVVVMSDNFTYSDGALETVSGGAWEINSGTGSKQVSSGKLVIDDVNTSDYQRQYDSAQTVASGIMMATFTLNVSAADPPNTAGTYFAAFAGPKVGTAFSTLFRSRVATFQTAADATAGKFELAISADSSGVASAATAFTPWATQLDFGTTYNIMHSYDLATQVAKLWVNPVDESSTSVSSTGAAGSGTFGAYLWRVSSSTVDGDKTVDDLVVSAPEPSAVALLAAGTVATMLRRRGKDRSKST